MELESRDKPNKEASDGMKDLGKELRELRIQKGYSLKEISYLTKFNLKYLEYLESNNFNFLPEVYVRSFLKTYVKVLDGNEKYFLELLDEILHKSETENTSDERVTFLGHNASTHKENEEPDITPKVEFFKKTIKIFQKPKVILLFVGLAFLVFLFLILYNTTDDSKEEVLHKNMKNEEKFELVDEKSSNFSSIVNKDSLTLGIKAVDSVWIQVKLDDKVVKEMYLRNGNYEKLRAIEKFYLFVGNAGGIVLYLNDKELPFVGNRGSVQRLQVDKNGVKLIQVKNEPER